ncbi:acyltransferase [Pseudoalteromonas arctica]|uniref:Acyltransferase n=1 Tax=Pseudoalteromonas arctica TaxID=394751 RepID=A0ABU9TDS1_9GAMM
MMIGSVAYLFPIVISNKNKMLLERLGLALIVGSYFIVSKEDTWPGYAALLPVLGALFVIFSARDESFVTGNLVFQKIGAWSYSIYLWQWPLLVGIYCYTLDDMYIFIGIALSMLLGFISNRYIERIRFKNGFHSARAYLKCNPLYIMLFISILSLIVIANKGDSYWVNNLDSTEYKTYYLLFNRDKESDDWGVSSEGGQNFSKCNFNSTSLTDAMKVKLKQCESTNNSGVLILGDSHSKDLFGMVSSAFENDFIVGITNTQGCRPNTQKNIVKNII